MIDGTEFRLEVLHTPGHAPNHLCFFLDEERILFTGDTILDGMYSVVSPKTGGDMAKYMATLERLRKMRLSKIAPGPRRRDRGAARPHRRVPAAPQAAREADPRRPEEGAGEDHARSSPTLYPDTPEPLLPVAGKQVHAHLLKLRAEGKVAGRDAKSVWKLA